MPQKFIKSVLDEVPGEHYDMTDYAAIRRRTLDNVKAAIASRFPLSNSRYTLSLSGLEYDNKQFYTPREQAEAIYEGRTLGINLKGRYVLTDNETGKEVSSSGKKILLSVPYLTDRGTYIRNGHEMTIGNIMRMRPGVYSRMRNNGQYEAHVNPDLGSGTAFKVEMNPDDGVFVLRRNTARLKLYPILKRMGITDHQLEETWGADLLEANRNASPGSVVRQKPATGVPVNRLVKTASETEAGDEAGGLSGPELDTSTLEAELAEIKLDPEVTARTLGKAYSGVTPYTLLDISGKLLRLSRGEDKPDVRDSLEFQKFYGAPELFAERIAKDGGHVARNLLWKATNKGNLDFIGPRSLNKHMDAVFNESGVANYIEGSCPVDMMEGNLKISKIGQGGIDSMDSAPEEARYTRDSYLGFLDGIKTPESLSVGLDLFASDGVRKGADGLLYNKFVNARTGRSEWVSSAKAAASVVATPEYLKSRERFVPAFTKDGARIVPRGEVDYYLEDAGSMFSPSTNMVPVIGGIAGMRANMGSRYSAQSVPLVSRQAPLVRTVVHGESVQSRMGRQLGIVKASTAGKVKSVSDDEIVVAQPDGSDKSYYLYNNFPANQKGYLRNIAAVKPGQEVKPGQLLAYSNYTDKDGLAAVGVNLRTAYMPYKLLNYEDGIVISESAARKLTSEHMNHYSLNLGDGTFADKAKFMSAFPGKFSKEQFDTIGADGLVKKGTVLKYGDPVILGITENAPSPLSMGRRTVVSRMEIWDKDYPGVVVESKSTAKGAKVFVRANAPMQVGDKLANFEGGKGVVTEIVPDSRMPTDLKGRPVEVLMDPLGVVGRANPAQLVEGSLGKVAEKTGRPYELPRFFDGSLVEFAENELRKNGLSDTEDLFNPETGKIIPGVFVGVNYYSKLKHLSELKKSGRGTGGYTLEDIPARGGEEGSKGLGSLELSAMVGHGAMKVLKDAKLIRGQRSDEFWRDFRLGRSPVMPGEPFINKKLYAYLQGAGINMVKDRNRTKIYAMTDKDVHEMAEGREVKSAQTYDARSFEPVDGGLFGRDVFGPDGDRWGMIKLDFKIPNPVMEDGIRKILGMTTKDYSAVMSGQKELDGKKGPEAIADALSKIDVDRELSGLLTTIKTSSGAKRDTAIKRYRILGAMKENGVEPADFMLSAVPVVPPKFRPISSAGSLTMVADSNYLYRQLIHSLEDYREAQRSLPASYKYPLMAQVYNNFKAVTGLADPDDVKLQAKNVGGLLKWVFGKGSPKAGAYNRRVIGTALDMVGRAVITVNPSLKLNEVGLPEKSAWSIYEPFVVRDLVGKGYPVTTAVKMTADKTQQAYSSLKKVIQERPVLINRAPTLHKFGIMAAWPRLTKGSTLQLSPTIIEPFNADFDGNCVDFDSIIVVKLSKFELNLFDRKVYCTYNLNKEEVMRTAAESRLEVRDGEAVIGLKIGDVPRLGDPVKDRNGANVYQLPDSFEVLSFNPDRGYEFSKALKLTVEEGCECVDVCIADRHVVVSANESLAVYDPDTGLMVKAAPSVDEKRFIPVLAKDPMPAGSKGDRDLGWWIGSFLSGGWVSKTIVGYANLEDIKRKEFERIARVKFTENFLCKEYSTKAGDPGKLGASIKIHCIGKELADKVSALNLSTKRPAGDSQAMTKTIPEQLIAEGSEDFLWGLLSGLLDGNGSFSVNRSMANPRFSCRISTSSGLLRDSITRLLYRLGVRFSVTTISPRGFSDEAYSICLSTVDMFKCLDRLSCIGEKERSVIAEWRNSPPGDKFSKDVIPLSRDEARILADHCLHSNMSIYSKLKECSDVPRISRLSLLGVSEDLKMLGLDNLLARALNREVIWSTISKVSPAGRRQVFDFEVVGNKVFVVNNGVVIYDTMNYHVPVSTEAVQEAIDKMMPEKNLLATRTMQAHYKPIRAASYGLYLASRPPEGAPRKAFRTEEEAVAAYRKGEIDIDTPIRVG